MCARTGWTPCATTRARRLREAKIGVSAVGIAGNAVQVRIAKAEEADAALKALKQMVQPLGNPIFGTTGIGRGRAEGRVRQPHNRPHRRPACASAQSMPSPRPSRRCAVASTPWALRNPISCGEGTSRILVQVPGLSDTVQLKELIGKTARLSFHEVHPTLTAAEAKTTRVPAGFKIYPGVDKTEGDQVLKETPVVRGDELTTANPAFDSRTNEPIIDFGFNNSGARKFGKFTQDHVGKPFAIVLDDKVISAPVIREAILGGRGQISGSFTPETATQLAIQLRSGALPAKLTVVEERNVGPSLGNNSIEAGKLAGIIGGIATIVLTILVYGTFGIFACVGLIVHGVLTVAIMALIGSALTLPGIAGLVLGIAMAVDANVLIYERIREELRAGKTPIAAIDAGFTRAFITIADSQLTTLACALVMFWLGAGPIRGFAVTLTIGICTSIFASVTVVRLLIYYWLNSMRQRVRGPFEVPV